MRNLKTRPIRSVLARRKMFANGGMMAPNIAPQGPAGILASSQPLMQAAGQQGQFPPPAGQQGQFPAPAAQQGQSFVDSMTQDAVNPMGGGTMAMAQGGAAVDTRPAYVFQEGGVAGFQRGGTGISSPRRGTPTQLGLGAAPEDVMERYDATPFQRMENIFPDEAALKAGFTGGQLLQKPRTGPSTPALDVVSVIPEFYDNVARLASQLSMHAANALWDIGQTALTTNPEPWKNYDRLFDQVEGANDLLRRMPRVKGVHPEQISGEISALAKQIMADDPTISGKDMKLQISDFIYNKYEVPSEPYVTAKEFAEVEMPAFMEAEGDVGLGSVAERIATAQNPPDPNAVPAFMADEPHAFLQDAPGRDEFGDTGPIVAEAPADTDVPIPVPRPTLEERGINEIIDEGSVGGIDDGETLVDDGDPLVDDGDPLVPVEKPIIQNPMAGDARVAEASYARQLIKDAANAGDTKKTTKGIESYIQEFKDAIPKYEGKTEYEQGMDLVKMGMAIAAGESPNAITNIAKGVMATIDNFTSDDKERRTYKRQVDLSAAKYGLENVARVAAEDRSDARKVFFFYDQSKKNKDNPYGQMVTVTMADIIANDGKIPAGLAEKDLVSRSITNANASTLRLQKLITDNAKAYRINATEAAKLEEDLSTSRVAFVSGQVGIDLLSMVKAQVAKGDITGLGNAGKELYRRAFAAAGLDVNKKYKNISAARADIRRAFQSLIPLSLGSTQSANSISNRDVQFLADAYINSGFLKDGIFSFATVDSEALGGQLDGAIGKFRESQKRGLATYEKVLERIQSAESGISGARALGVPVSPGPFGREYFKSTLTDIGPYAKSTRARLEGKRVKPMFTQKSFGALKGFDFIDGKYVPTKGK
jgi:hypothetical protein